MKRVALVIIVLLVACWLTSLLTSRSPSRQDIPATVTSLPITINAPTVTPFVRALDGTFTCPRNCDEARLLGLTAEEAGRCPRLDRDDDGVACYGD